MELRHLRYFAAVAELENVSQAASKLHVSQPALSRQIRDLEEELGFPLLERTAKSVRLTEAGRVFYGETLAVLQRTAQATTAARAVAMAGREDLHIGYSPTLTARILPGSLRAFGEIMPNVRVKLHDLATEEILEGLRGGKLDLGLSVRPAKSALRGLAFSEVLREPLRLAVAPGHALAQRGTVSLAEAARQPFIAYSRLEYPDYHEMLAAVFAPLKVRPRVTEEHDGVASLISGIEASAGVAVVPESISCIAGVRLKLLELTPPPKPLPVGVLCAVQEQHPGVKAFIECARAAAAQSGTVKRAPGKP